MLRWTLANSLAVLCVFTAAATHAQGQGEPGGRFVDSGLVVVDKQTNLIWEKKTTAVGSGENPNDPHDADNKYDWCQVTGNQAGRCGRNPDSWIGQVNAEKFAGASNWRVPTKEELLSIVNDTCGKGTACLDPIFGPTQAADYWSSSEVSPNVAWIVVFSTGNLRFGDKSNAGLAGVRAVRNGP